MYVCVGEDSWESLGLQGDPTSPSWRRSVLGVHWKDWCWSWNSNPLATSWEELTHWKRPWCLEGLGAGGEGDNRGWDGWMASLTRWAWVWVNSGSLWWTGRPGVLRFMGSQRVGHDWVTELNWLICVGVCDIYYQTLEIFNHCFSEYYFSTHSSFWDSDDANIRSLLLSHRLLGSVYFSHSHSNWVNPTHLSPSSLIIVFDLHSIVENIQLKFLFQLYILFIPVISTCFSFLWFLFIEIFPFFPTGFKIIYNWFQKHIYGILSKIFVG